MFRAVLNRLTTALGRNGDDEAESGFVPSVLDASVRYAHGGGGAEVEREIADIDEEARRLEERRRDR